MPAGPNDKAQQPLGSGFPGSNLYPNKNIWNASIANGRERSSVASKGPSSFLVHSPNIFSAPSIVHAIASALL